MKTLSCKRAVGAFTLVELLVVAAMLAILVALLLPAMDHRPTRATIVHCINNLRQVGIALQMFADDNNGQFPQQVSITNGGSLELIASNSPVLHFRTLSNYLHGSQLVWHCQADDSRQPLTNNSALTDANLSYFFSVDATHAMTNAIHAGDRNLQVAGQPVKPGLFTLTTNAALGWTREMHTKYAGRRCGNLLFVDAHVQVFQANLPLASAVQHQDLTTNRLVVP
jgi:prepilin-type processing-associated H-X9-DG protein